MSTTKELAIVPRDGLFCKDGRGWFTSASGRGHSLDWPWPSTVLGAVRALWGNTQESKRHSSFSASEWIEETKSVELRKIIVLRRHLGEPWSSNHRVWPVPTDAVWLEDECDVVFLKPGPTAISMLGRNDDAERESLWLPKLTSQSKPKASPRWWSEQYFIDWLCGESLAANNHDNFFSTTRRVQSHVGIDPLTLAAKEGVLYSHDVIETVERAKSGGLEWSIGAEVALLKEEPDSQESYEEFSTLGGDGRIVRFENLARETFEAPQKLLEKFAAGSKGIRMILTTPGCFENGWIPDGFSKSDGHYKGKFPGLPIELVLRAAYVSRPVHISGWDMALCKPKPTSRMVPAGTVYFLERNDSKEFSEAEARAIWLNSVGERTNEGFGLVVPGIWHI